MSDDVTNYSVIVSKRAAMDLYKHVEFLSRVSTTAANRLTDDFERAFQSLSKLPERCPVVRTRKTKNPYRRLIVGHYKVLFSIDEEKKSVIVRGILDARQDNGA